MSMSKQLTARLRSICLALPEATEKEAWGDPTFRCATGFSRWRSAATVASRSGARLHPGARLILVAADPALFFVPPYVGSKGWIGMRLDASPDWDEVAIIVRRSYRLTAPKKLAVQLGEIDAVQPQHGTDPFALDWSP